MSSNRSQNLITARRQNVNGIPPDRNGISLNYNNCITMWQWSTAVTDVTVSICLACTLSSRRQGVKPRTDGLLKRLVSTAISSAAYTAVLATLGGALLLWKLRHEC